MSGRLTWEEKLAACQALGECCLKMRKPGDWYVSQNVHVKQREGDGVMIGRYGNGTGPADAIDDHFNSLTAEEPLAYVIVGNPSDRRHVRWNGFMWVDVLPAADPGVSS